MDRVGGGDSFASGLIYGFLAGAGPQQAVDYGAAHGALAMTTPGDTSMATLAEVKKAHGRRQRAGGAMNPTMDTSPATCRRRRRTTPASPAGRPRAPVAGAGNGSGRGRGCCSA